MWLFILLYILGLNISQGTAQGNSTQMYYVKLTIEKGAIGNITNLLEPFVTNTTLRVDNLEKTTTCQTDSTDTQCECEPYYRWSAKVCKSNPKCCYSNECTFSKNAPHMCVSNNTVTVNGSIVLKGQDYLNCLAEKNSVQFQNCNSVLLQKMKAVYSTLKGFDILTITKYSAGSIIANFEMTISNNLIPQDLINKSEFLSMNLSASLVLDTAGVVHLSMPQNPVCYNSQHNLKCTAKENLNALPVWQLAREDDIFDITNGTESLVTSKTLQGEVALKNISKLWSGAYTCAYHQKSELYTISHKASALMDVALLPKIDITTHPGFPYCQTSSDLLNVKVQCEIQSSMENYTVTWTKQGITAEIMPLPDNSSERINIYAATTVVTCNPPVLQPQVTCTFRNRCNQNRSASVNINIIREHDQFCKAEGDWPVTKAEFTAVLKCNNAAGQRQRTCKQGSTQAIWEPEFSACVNQQVNNVLEKANIVDIGLGSLDGNAAQVFALLEDATNNSQSINTFANVNASVQVLFTLSQKQNLQPNESMSDDFLNASSNLLERSLNKSWETTTDNGNVSVAERYLTSVEQLIQVANITGVPKKKNIEVAASNCSQGSQCTNTVFNVTVLLLSQDHGTVKTAGFKELESYLPNRDDKYTPNSIVVSTTTENKQSESVEVKIDFKLLKPRPRNVELQCVSWDNKTGSWSPLGCKWNGPFNEEQCVCSHLSSFAILMSKKPVDVPGITEITYAGLSVSVVSLIISLAIELTVWSAVVKSNTLYLRHLAHVNISLCLLVADCCFLASSKPSDISSLWCQTFVVLKHFCYLAMFFWMLSLSTTLLHQAVFLFHNLSKKHYLRFSFVLGYVCPLLIVAITFLAYKGGAEGFYYSSETCWLVYTGLMNGSIHTFVIPVGVIVFVNVFSMLVVIMKLLDHPKNAEKSNDKDKKTAITVVRSVILLTPVFGVTWMFGFAVMLLDLTSGNMVLAVNYIFTLLNAFQGLFIFLTTCLGDKLTREALLNRLRKSAPALTTDSTTKLDSSWKN